MLFKCTIEYLSEGAGLSERASTELPSSLVSVAFQNTTLIDHFNGPISLWLFLNTLHLISRFEGIKVQTVA